MLKDIGKIIRFHRKKAGLSQNELALLAKIGKATVFDIEKGKETVQMDSIQKVLLVLNIKIEIQGPLMGEYLKEIK